VDALGHPLKIILTAGQVHDLAGADALVPRMEAETLLADKAYDADKRVIEPLEAVGKTAVIPPKKNRKSPRTYDKALYVARHLIENFFCCVSVVELNFFAMPWSTTTTLGPTPISKPCDESRYFSASASMKNSA
jgi:transposase